MKYHEVTATPDEAEALITDICARYKRVVICGRPGIGKNFLTRNIEGAWDSDEVLPASRKKRDPWTAQREMVTERLAPLDRFIALGVTMSRCLRHGLRADAVVLLLGTPFVMQPSAANRLGDSAERWTDEAMRQPQNVGVEYYIITIVRTRATEGRKEGRR